MQCRYNLHSDNIRNGRTSTAARISEMALHFCSPSDAAPTTSGIYFSKDKLLISLSNAAWLSPFTLVRRRLMNAVFFFKLESRELASLKMPTVNSSFQGQRPVSPSHTLALRSLSCLFLSLLARSSGDSPTMKTWLYNTVSEWSTRILGSVCVPRWSRLGLFRLPSSYSSAALETTGPVWCHSYPSNERRKGLRVKL